MFTIQSNSSHSVSASSRLSPRSLASQIERNTHAHVVTATTSEYTHLRIPFSLSDTHTRTRTPYLPIDTLTHTRTGLSGPWAGGRWADWQHHITATTTVCYYYHYSLPSPSHSLAERNAAVGTTASIEEQARKHPAKGTSKVWTSIVPHLMQVFLAKCLIKHL